MFHDYEIDACPAFGWMGGPTASVRIKELRNRHERRNREAALMRHSYTLPFQNLQSSDYLDELKSAFMVFGGPADSFLVKDFWDHLLVSEPIGVGNETRVDFQIIKRYTLGSGGSAFYDRLITKPKNVVIRVAGNVVPAEIDPLTGIATLEAAPGAGVPVTATGEFRVPVRFASFEMTPTIDNRFGNGQYAMNGSCSLIEVFGE